MPDISKCKGRECTVRDNCYRYTSKDDLYQSYFGKEPHEKVGFAELFKCDYFWVNNKIELLPKVKEIFNKYPLEKINLSNKYKDVYQYLEDNPSKKDDYISNKDDLYFLDKYKAFIPKGWYGFAIGNPIIPEWMEIVDDILELCIKHDPRFEIKQIKLKFGIICFYVNSHIIEDICEIESLVGEKLQDEKLIY